MDDRRRTISSEDSMVGEALMRISNTMEADRLTKSLDYQEKLRSRANIRLILAIICIVIAFMMFFTGGLLLYVLIKYEDPILDTWIPLLRAILNGMNVGFQSTIEATTYLPELQKLMIAFSQDSLKSLQNLNSIDFAGILNSLGSTLGDVSAMIGDAGTKISELLTSVGSGVTDAVTSLTDGSIFTSLASSIKSSLAESGIDVDTLAKIVRNVINTLANVSEKTNNLNAAKTAAQYSDSNVNAISQAAGNLFTTISDLLAGSGKSSALSATADTVNSLSNSLSGLAGIAG